MICFIWGSKKHQRWKTVLLNYAFVKKTKKHPLKSKFWKKKKTINQIFFENIGCGVFLSSLKNFILEGVFGVFLLKENPTFCASQKKVWNEI